MASEHDADAVKRLIEDAGPGASDEPREEVLRRAEDEQAHAVRGYVERLHDGDWTLDELVEAIAGRAEGES